MKKQFLSLGKSLNKAEQKQISGGGIITRCVNEGDFCEWVSSSGYGTGTCQFVSGNLLCLPN